MGYTILLAEDERDMREVVADYFAEKSGGAMTVEAAADGDTALAMIGARAYDLLLLDIMLPGTDGFALCRAARERGDVPILFVTAREDEQDKLHGYGLGADDYVVKPFSLAVLYAKAQALIRRAKGLTQDDVLAAGALVLDPARGTVTAGGQPVALPPKEFALLRALMERKNRVLTRDELLNLAWGWDYDGTDRVIDSHIKKLRRALGRTRAASKPWSSRATNWRWMEMKTKRRNYWSFFWRVGAGFLAFWLVVMTGLSLLLSWQTAQEMQKEMDIEAYHFIREWVPEQLYFYAQNTDEVLLQDLIGGAFLWFDYRTFNEDVRPSETGVLSGSGEVIQSNQSWVRVIEPGWQEKIDRGEFAPTYYVVMDNQPREVITMLVECNMLYNMDDVTIEGWLDHNKVYPKSISGQPAAWVVQENGDAQRENTAARRTIDCTYNASQMAGRELKTFELNNTLMPSISDLTPEQMVDILTSPRRMALREWVTTKHEGTADQKTVCKPWIVSYAAYHVIPTAAVPEGYVVAQYASEGYLVN